MFSSPPLPHHCRPGQLATASPRMVFDMVFMKLVAHQRRRENLWRRQRNSRICLNLKAWAAGAYWDSVRQ